MLPWMFLLASAVVAVGGAYALGRSDGTKLCQARVEQATRAAAAARQQKVQATAVALSNVKVRHAQDRQEAAVAVQNDPGSSCRASADSLRHVNAALSDSAASGPAGPGLVPKADPPER